MRRAVLALTFVHLFSASTHARVATAGAQSGFRRDADDGPSLAESPLGHEHRRVQTLRISQAEGPGAEERLLVLESLIAQETDPARRAEFEVERIGLALAPDRDRALKPGETRASALASAVAALKVLVREPALPAAKRAYADYLLGLALLDSGDEVEGVRSLESASRARGAGKFVDEVGVYLGTRAYAQKEWKRALEFFAGVAKPSAEQRYEMAYLSARCWLGLGEIARAEAGLESVTLSSSPFRGEAAMAWGEAVARSGEARAIAVERDKLKTRPEALEFLTGAYWERRRLAPQDPAYGLLDQLLKRETRPERRLRLLQSALRSAKTPTASEAYWAAFTRLKCELDAYLPKASPAAAAEAESFVGPSLEAMIRIFADAYAGRTKERSDIRGGRSELAKRMIDLFSTYENLSPRSKLRASLYGLWLDVCADQKDYACVHEVTGRVQSDDGLVSVKPRATQERLAALDGLSEGPGGSAYRSELIVRLEELVKQKTAPDWLKYAKRLAALHAQDKAFAKAIPVLEAIDVRERSEASFFALQSVRYEAGEFEIVANAKIPPAAASERTRALAREAALKRVQANEKGDLATLERAVDRFLEVDSDKSASMLALRSLLARYAEERTWAKAANRLKSLTLERRSASEIQAFERRVFAELMKGGDFRAASSLSEGSPLPFESALARLGDARDVTWSSIQKLPPERREALYLIASLAAPRQVAAWADHGSDRALKRAASLAREIDLGKTDLGARVATPSKSEKMGDAIRFTSAAPGTRSAPSAMKKELNSKMEAVRRVRAQAARDVQSTPRDSHGRILTAAARVERAMAKSIEEMPAPAGMSADGAKAFRAGLAQLAREFHDQATEYDRATERISARLVSEGAHDPAWDDEFPENTPLRWPWPKCEATPLVLKLLESGRYAAALIALDLRKSASQIAPDDYAGLRAGTLLHRRRNRPMRLFIRSELKADGQLEWIQKWKNEKSSSK